MSDTDDTGDARGTGLTDWWERRGDLAVTLVLTVLTLLTAWAGFQSAKWSGVQAVNFSDAGRARADSNAAASIGTSTQAIDVALFISWLEASTDVFTDEQNVDPTSATTEGLPGYLYARFSDPLRVATDDWLDQGLALSGEPTTPLDLDSYVNAPLLRSEELREEASDFADAARANNQQSDHYVLITVLFASGMFLAGLCQKLDLVTAQVTLFFVSFVILVFGAIIMLGQPIEFSEADLPW